MQREVKLRIPEELHRHLRETALVYRVSLNALVAGLLEDRMAGRRSFEEQVAASFSELQTRLSGIERKIGLTEILLDEFFLAYLWYTPEIPKDFEGRKALAVSQNKRYEAIWKRIDERVKKRLESRRFRKGSREEVAEEMSGDRGEPATEDQEKFTESN